MSWELRKSMFPEVAQTLQEARKGSRMIETVSGSLSPLTSSDSSEQDDLAKIELLAREISILLTKLYSGIARDAFGPDSVASSGVVR